MGGQLGVAEPPGADQAGEGPQGQCSEVESLWTCSFSTLCGHRQRGKFSGPNLCTWADSHTEAATGKRCSFVSLQSHGRKIKCDAAAVLAENVT